MANNSIVWTGKALTARMKRAQIKGVNGTMVQCVQHAKGNHDWQNRTGILEGSLGIAAYARELPDGVIGSWGSKDNAYARIHELGGTIYPRNAKALAIPDPKNPEGVILVSSVTIPKRPYLRPAADIFYPALAENIRKAFESDKGGRSA